MMMMIGIVEKNHFYCFGKRAVSQCTGIFIKRNIIILLYTISLEFSYENIFFNYKKEYYTTYMSFYLGWITILIALYFKEMN